MNAMAIIPELHDASDASDASDAPDAAQATGGTEGIEDALHQYIDITKPYAVQRDAVLEAFRKAYVALLLAHTNGNRSRAARIAQVERSHFTKLANRLGGRRER